MKVHQFARDVNQPVEDVIADLELAGINGKTEDSDFSDAEMAQLLNFRINGRVQQVDQGTFRVASSAGRQSSDYEITVSTRGGRRLSPLQVAVPPTLDGSADEPKADAIPDEQSSEDESEEKQAPAHADADDAVADLEVSDQPEQADAQPQTPDDDVSDPQAQDDTTDSAVSDIADVVKQAKDSEGVSDKRPAKKAKPRRKAAREAPPHDEVGSQRLRIGKGKAKLKKERERRPQRKALDLDHNKHGFKAPTTPTQIEVRVLESNSITDLAHAMKVKAVELTFKWHSISGSLLTINDTIDKEEAQLLIEEMGHRAVEASATDIESSLINQLQGDYTEVSRHPVVAVMGHVDHGKTTLLDSIRSTKVVATEKGGITQHIGAYTVDTKQSKITFFDTPGHEAFTKMRIRGAKATDLVILVVAADDGVKPQTVEAISHARSAKVPIIIAVNKIDKSKADTDRVLRELTEHDVIAEKLGGDIQVAEISALKNTGIDALLELVHLEAELLDLKAPAEGPARGVVIEARVDKGRGKVATVLVQQGKLKTKDMIVAGVQSAKIRTLTNDAGKSVRVAMPSTPVEVEGFRDVPVVGDDFYCVPDERTAQQLIEFRQKGISPSKKSLVTEHGFGAPDMPKQLNVLIKADVRGSAEALSAAVMNLASDDVQVNVIHDMVGNVSQSDVDLAVASKALIIAFNTKVEATARNAIAKNNVKVVYSNIIYDAIDSVQEMVENMSEPKFIEEVIAKANVREVFKIGKVGTIAGCYIEDGTVRNDAAVRVWRNDQVIHDGIIKSLKRFENDVPEVKAGNECGILIKNFNDVSHEDRLEIYRTMEAG